MGPFSIAFYLILDVAVGGTNGWFPDGAGDGATAKPWLNGAISADFLFVFSSKRLNLNDVLDAMQQFAQAQDTWYPTWPESEDDRAMRMYAPFLLFDLHVHCSDTRAQRIGKDVGAVLRKPLHSFCFLSRNHPPNAHGLAYTLV
jgi:hypothetical protein